jgi:uncharacterized OB-fold protein
MEIPRHWRLKAQRYRLEGTTCPSCGEFIFPPHPVCPHCTAQQTRIAEEKLPISLTSIARTEIESHIPYRITERIIG